jgi:DNA-directed RNA polymerase subunit alpha
MELTVERGRGYVSAEDNKSNNASIGTIFIDSIYTPIKSTLNYTIENYRVEQKTDYERLILDIVTDGSIHPKDALKEAAKILIFHFMLFSDEKITLDAEEKRSEEEFDETSLHMRQLIENQIGRHGPFCSRFKLLKSS